MVIVYPQVLDFIERLEESRTVEGAWSSLLRFAGRHGFSCGALAELPNPAEKFDDQILAVTWPQGWQQRYLERDYIRDDPAVLHMREVSGPYSWQEMLDFPDYTKHQRNIVLEASEFGLTAGFLVPMMGLRRGGAILTLSGENCEPSRRERAELHLAAIYAHAHIARLANRNERKPAPLTRRERECLQWAAAGKTDWEISEILSISEKTANAHIEHAKEKFGVGTRVQAVVLAIRAGLIQA